MSEHITRDLYRFIFPVQVRWGDMDAMGHVNNIQIIRFTESARIAYIDELLGAGRAFRTDGPGLIVANVNCDFLAQLKYPTNVDVGVRIRKIGSSSLQVEMAVFERDSDTLVALCTTIAVWFDYPAGQARPVPDDIRARIREFEKTPPEEN